MKIIKFFEKKYRFAFFYSLILVIFTIYVILDTFLVSKAYVVVEDDNLSENIPEGSYTSNSYTDENINININNYRQYNTNIYVADIVLTDVKYLKTAFAKNTYGKNIIDKTSTIAYNKNAILAINGDFYGVQEKGYVLKNGTIYRKEAVAGQEDLVIYENGVFDIINESDISLADLQSRGAYNLLSFGPGLLLNGNVMNIDSLSGRFYTKPQPRTAIGMIDSLHYVFVVADGRTDESEGLTITELATFLKDLNVATAYNLDGGGSSTMYFHQMLINDPTTDGETMEERWVSDIVYIGY
jgi:exopolysaccharide biosynthesis protein